VGLVRRGPGGRERAVIEGMDARFAAGAVSLITGGTGAGKTSLLLMLAGLFRPTEGEILAGDQPVSRWTSAHRDRWRREVGVVLQTPRLLPGLTVLENVLVRLVAAGGDFAGMRARALGALGSVDAGSLAGKDIRGLSGGERQRVALARALAGRPAYLILDEPTAHQDPDGVERLSARLAEARDHGCTVVVATHDPRMVAERAVDARLVLEAGRLGAQA
jgi:ABC-type lipoprotein export system ATPase subunit